MASLTIPAITKSVSYASIGPTVGRCAEAFETGMSTIFGMAQNRAVESSINIDNAISSLQVKDVMSVTADSSVQDSTAYLADNQNLYLVAKDTVGWEVLPDDEKAKYISKPASYDGNTVLFQTAANYSVNSIGKTRGYIITENITGVNSDYAADRVIARVYIDGNRTDGPNRLGHDIFLFGLTNSGKLVPAGSPAYNNNIYSETINLYTEDCNGTTINDARSCTARLAADNWKIKY